MAIKHAFTSTKSDGVDTSLVRPSNWNAEHVCTDGAVLGNVALTLEGGIAVKLTNKTGVASVKGSLVSASTTTDDAFILQGNEFDTFGIVYESGVADGSECWVVVSGIAELLIKDATAVTRGHIAIAADTDGRAIGIAVPTGTPTANDHWKEVGHFIAGCSAGTDNLVKAVVHYN